MRQLKWSLLAAYVVGCSFAWRKLPPRFPFHFDRFGIVDKWADKSITSWFMMPALLFGLLLIMELVTFWSVRHPRLWNVPEKERFLAMTDEQRRPIYQELGHLMDAISIGILLLFAAIQYTMYSVALRHYSRMPFVMIFTALVFTVGAIIYTFISNAKIKDLILSTDVKSTIGSTG